MFSVILLLCLFVSGSCSQDCVFTNNRYSEAACLLEAIGYSPEFVDSALASCYGEPMMSSISKERNGTLDKLENKFRLFSANLINKIDNIENSVKNVTDFFKVKPSNNKTLDKVLISAMQNLADVKPRDCYQLKELGDDNSGIKTIYIESSNNFPVKVQCDQDTEGGGWTVIQSRKDLNPRENFQRSWIEYVMGFGNVTGEYWLGLEKIHLLTKKYLLEARFDMEDYEGDKRYAKYGYFHVDDASAAYKLSIGDYSGTAGDSFSEKNNHKFSTKDRDNDVHAKNCAEIYKGGSWFTGCHSANINGYPYEGKHDSYADGINWKLFKGYHYSLKSIEMKIRPAYP